MMWQIEVRGQRSEARIRKAELSDLNTLNGLNDYFVIARSE